MNTCYLQSNSSYSSHDSGMQSLNQKIRHSLHIWHCIAWPIYELSTYNISHRHVRLILIKLLDTSWYICLHVQGLLSVQTHGDDGVARALKYTCELKGSHVSIIIIIGYKHLEFSYHCNHCEPINIQIHLMSRHPYTRLF